MGSLIVEQWKPLGSVSCSVGIKCLWLASVDTVAYHSDLALGSLEVGSVTLPLCLIAYAV